MQALTSVKYMIQELDQKNMDAVKELANTSIKISEAKNILFKLQEDETEYLIQRENKALEKINQVLGDSKDILKQAHENYDEIHKFCQTISEYTKYLAETQEKIHTMIEIFDERQTVFNAEVEKQQQEILEIKKGSQIDRVLIENEKKNLQNGWKKLEEARKKLDSDRGTVERAIKRLKEGRI